MEPRYLSLEEYKLITGQDPAQDYILCEEEAARLIDALTMYRLIPDGLEMYPELIQKQVKAASARIISMIYDAGGYETYIGKMHQKITAEKVGGYSVNYTAGTNIAQRLQQCAISYLAPTGLLYRGIG